MKTTLEIPDSLYREAKATAARQGQTVKEFITEALTEKLEAVGKGHGWRAVLGKLTPAGREAAREADALIKVADFNKIDATAW